MMFYLANIHIKHEIRREWEITNKSLMGAVHSMFYTPGLGIQYKDHLPLKPYLSIKSLVQSFPCHLNSTERPPALGKPSKVQCSQKN